MADTDTVSTSDTDTDSTSDTDTVSTSDNIKEKIKNNEWQSTSKIYDSTVSTLKQQWDEYYAKKSDEAANDSTVAKQEKEISDTVAKKKDAVDVVERFVEDCRKQYEKDQVDVDQITQDMTDKKAVLDLRIFNIAQKMSEMAVIDMIAKKVLEQENELKSSSLNTNIMQQIIVDSYIARTFGSGDFMSNVHTTISDGVKSYLDALEINESIRVDKKISDTLDQAEKRVDEVINQTTSRASNLLTTIEKIDIATSLDDRLDKCLSIDSLNKSLNKTFLGQIIAPGVNVIYNVAMESLKTTINTSAFGIEIKSIQDKLVAQQLKINEYKDMVESSKQIALNYINGLKSEAQQIVTSYANRIVDDIKNKISISISGGGISF